MKLSNSNDRLLPCLYNTLMIQANMDGRKKRTSRPVKCKGGRVIEYLGWPIENGGWFDVIKDGKKDREQMFLTPRYRAGDILWGRETWADLRGMGFGINPLTEELWIYAYKSDILPGSESERLARDYGVKWRPSIHMPFAAARLFQTVTGARVQELDGMTERDALDDGFLPTEHTSALQEFQSFWHNTYPGDRLMWVYDIERCDKPEVA